MQRISLLLCLLVGASSIYGQTTVSGCVFDENEKPLIGATVVIVEELELSPPLIVSDSVGCFTLQLPADSVTLRIASLGYTTQLITIDPANKEELVVRLIPNSGVAYEIKVFNQGTISDESISITDYYPSAKEVGPPKAKRISSETTRDLPTRSINGIAATAAGLSSSDDGAPMRIRGSRADATSYYVDGVRVEMSSGYVAPEPAGQLTAGEINDFGKWELWDDISKEDLSAHRSTWGFYPERRYTVQLTFPGGSPVVDASVRLTDRTGKTIYTASTDNQGRAELWAGLFDQQSSAKNNLNLLVRYAGQQYDFGKARSFSAGINSMEIPGNCVSPTQVDVAFVIDATGSMGDEINYLKAELLDVMARSRDSLSAQDVNFSAVFYRDRGEEYVTRKWPFGSPDEKLIEFFSQQRASGGGDNPEAVEAALDLALNELSWSETASARLLFLVLDAPPHQDEKTVKKMQQLTLLAAEKGIRIIPVVCSGMQQDGEYLLRSLALATNGTYTFLTDHSGIGNPHLEPSTDAYEVEQFNDLIVRLVYQYGYASDCENPVARRTEVNEEEVPATWKAFPNPTVGPVNVDLATSQGSLSLFDLNGKLLQHRKVASKRERLELGQLPGGTYLLRYEYQSEVSTQRIVVSRS